MGDGSPPAALRPGEVVVSKILQKMTALALKPNKEGVLCYRGVPKTSGSRNKAEAMIGEFCDAFIRELRETWWTKSRLPAKVLQRRHVEDVQYLVGLWGPRAEQVIRAGLTDPELMPMHFLLRLALLPTSKNAGTERTIGVTN
eukprot:gene35286-64061_t